MGTMRHVCLHVRGALINKSFEGFNNEDGSPTKPSEVQDYLLEQLSLGRERLPMGEMCEGFSYKTGCPGHDKKDKP